MLKLRILHSTKQAMEVFHGNSIFNPTRALLSLDKGVTWNKTTFQHSTNYGCLVSNELMYYVRSRTTIYSVGLNERYGEAMSLEVSPLISAMVFLSQNLGIVIGDNGAILGYTN